MQCRLCGTQLPQSANYCPVCGTAVLHKVSSASTSSPLSSQAVANTHTRHQKRGLTPDAKTYKGKQPHLSSETVRESTRPRPLLSLPLRRRRSKVTLVICIALLVLVLVGSGLFVFALQRDSLQNPYPPYRGTLVLNNPLRENNNGYYHWTQTTLSNLSCRFMRGAYHIIQSGDSAGRLCAVTGTFRDFASEIQMTIVKGDAGGIVFRTDSAYTKGYGFLINTIGKYIFKRADSERPNSAKLLGRGSISAFHNGLNQSNLIAIVVQGNNIDLYVNRQHIIHVNDGIYRQGQIGVIGQGRNNEAEVVFRNAKVWMLAPPVMAQSTVSVIASVSPSQNPYFPSTGTLALNESLSENSNNNPWDTGTDNSGDSCEFSAGAYHDSSSTHEYIYPCTAQIDLRNFAYQVQMMILKGDGGGVIFCSDAAVSNFYYFGINRLGRYTLVVYKNNSYFTTLSSGYSSAFRVGLHQTNLIAVVSHGNNIDLYVNLQLVASQQDNTFSHGLIGVVADETLHPTEVAFSNAKVWKL
jgi:hypothetical protein